MSAESSEATGSKAAVTDPGSSDSLSRVVHSRVGPEPQPQPLTQRERLIEAGWAEADALPLSKAFTGVTTAAVSKRAGVTTGSFFHHFHNGVEFADAMALALAVPEVPPDHAGPQDGTKVSEFVDLVEMIRTALTQTWIEGSTSTVSQTRLRCEMRLWSFHPTQLSEPTDDFRTVGDIICRNYRIRQNMVSDVWTDALARSRRELLDPFDLTTVATAITALYQGLQLRSAVDPDAVDNHLFADVSAALVDAFTGPAGVKAAFEGNSVHLTPIRDQSPQARSGARRRRETWTRVVTAASGLFTDGWETVSAAEIADRAGISPQTVLNLFHSVRRVAAATFVSHANELYAFAVEDSVDDPMDGLRETLTGLAQRTVIDPEAARALLAERVAATMHRGNSMSDLDIRIEVPVGAAVTLWVNRLGLIGDRGTSLSTAIANFVLSTTLTGGLETSEIVAMALRLLPEELSGPARTRQAPRPD